MFNADEMELLTKLQDKRTKCQVFTRVMGYHRPVQDFNPGKKGEHDQRKPFVESKCGICSRRTPDDRAKELDKG